MQETRVRSPFREDPTCCGAPKPVTPTSEPVLGSPQATITEPLCCNSWSLSTPEPATRSHRSAKPEHRSEGGAPAPSNQSRACTAKNKLIIQKQKKRIQETKMNNTLFTWMQATKEKKGIFMPVHEVFRVQLSNYYIYDTIHNIFTNTDALYRDINPQ